MGKHTPLTPPPEIYFSDEPRGIAYAHLVDFALCAFLFANGVINRQYATT